MMVVQSGVAGAEALRDDQTYVGMAVIGIAGKRAPAEGAGVLAGRPDARCRLPAAPKSGRAGDGATPASPSGA